MGEVRAREFRRRVLVLLLFALACLAGRPASTGRSAAAAGDTGNPPRAETTPTPTAPAPTSDAELEKLAAAVRRAFDEGFHAKAESAARELLDKTAAAYGPQSVPAADALDLLVKCIGSGPSRREPDSRRLAEHAVDLRRRLHGPQDARYALSVYNLASLLERSGAADAALPRFEEALRITERDLGANHPQVATVLGGYGEHFRTSGDGARALALFERALAILEATPHPDTLALTMIMNSMAITHWENYEYITALRLYDRVLSLREARYGPEHPRVLGILNNKANLLGDLGDTAAALETYERILAELPPTLDDPDDPRIGVAEMNVARAIRTSDPARALRLYESALPRLRLRSGDSDDVARCLRGIACTHRDLGHVDKAISRFEEALAVATRAHDSEYWHLAFDLRHLAALHYDLGQFETARAEGERALSIAEKTLDDTSPEIAEILGVLGPVRAALGDTSAALQDCLRAEEIATEHLRLTARGVAEREALLYAGVRPHGLDLPLRFATNGLDPASRRRIWDALVHSRAAVLEEMASRSRGASLSSDPETARLVADVRRASTRLAGLEVAGPSGTPQSHAEAVAAARRDKDAAERALAARNASFRRDLDRERIGLTEVEAALPAGSALVAFVEYELRGRQDLMVPLAGRAAAERRLLAFVRDPRGEIHVAPIGTKRDIDSAVQAWIRAAARPPGADARAPAADMSSVRGEALRRLVWDPIEPHLGDARLVFVVPEGSVHKVNFAALPMASGHFLVETERILHLLAAERDIVGSSDGGPRGEGMLVLGGADFDAVITTEARIAGKGAVRTHTVPSPSLTRQVVPLPPCGGLEGVRFPPLPGSLREARLVAENWKRWRPATEAASPQTAQAVVLSGADATESALKSLAPGKLILHLATHGFVFASACPDAVPGARGIHAAPAPGARVPANPLQLAGLAFSGANHRDEVSLEEENNILTSEEAASLNLQGVEWAVLSGCDTGVGEVQTGEGVLGLRRAFQVAGARTLIMSLWAVSDAAACEWMEALYAARYRDGLGTAAAVHEATRRSIETRRRNGQSVHPFYWAAFVAAGDWR